MDAAEQMYFEGAPLAHVVTFRERQRLQRIDAQGRAAVRGMDRRTVRGRWA